jgi:tagatose 6-phosphate kinase
MIVCVGTTPVYQRTMVLERLTLDDVNRTADVHDYASGKSVNAARVLHELGEEQIALGFAGGSRGKILLEDMQQSRIRHDFVMAGPNTRQCITLIDRSNGTATELVEESRAVGPAAWQELETKMRQLANEAASGDVWLFAGTLPPASPEDGYARMVPSLLTRGVRIIADLQKAPLLAMLQHRGIIAKLNRDELGWTLGCKVDSEAALRAAVQEATKSGNAIVITLGKDGALAADGSGVWQESSPSVSTISAVGSGDSFAAGLAAGLRRGMTLHDACALASACGAANAMTAYAGHLRREDVERLVGEVTIRRG